MPPVQEGKTVEPTIVGVASAQPMLRLGNTPFTKTLTFDSDLKPKLMTALTSPPAQNAEPAAVVLRVEGIRPGKKPTVVFDVFLTKSGDKPSPRAYVGAISFFGRAADGHGHD